MTSPVDTSVKFFHSRMLGAPVLRGQAGSLISILDACLKDGWGVQVATSVVVSGGVCTMAFPLDHAALVECVVLVAGSSIAALNGEQKVTAVAPNVIKFATVAANGTATGTITVKMAPLGFAKPFSGTNLAVYKSQDVQANGQFLRVNDTSGLYARANGYETMTAVSTGTGLFPTAAQLNGGMYWHKSAVAGSTPVDWLLVGDGRFFAVFPSINQGNGAGYESYVSPSIFGFGDPVNLGRAADPFSTLIVGGVDTNANAGSLYPLTAANNQYRYMPRAVSGVGTAVLANIHSMSSIVAPDPMFDRITGRVSFSELVIKTDLDASWRAKLPGICLGDALYMERVMPPLTVFKGGAPERAYISHFITFSLGQTEALQLLAIDVTGPWR